MVSVEQVPAAGETTEVTRFADGSVAVTSLEQGVVVPDGVIAPRAVSGCSVWQDGLMRRKTNCTVSHSTGVISMSFKADYNQQFSAQDLAYATYGRIMAVRDAHINTFGGTYTVRNFGRTQIQATASSPAKARLTIDVQGAGGWFGGTAWLQLNVPMNTYTLGYSTHQY
ncbi:hypothetical protein H1Q78_00105 [Cellulosimicrobium cellulans]|uniref:hypothetical protein n=1 Tax=Cellulosimicrobium cellulans TaxID=1710 RepID=UPI001EDC1FAF|nr:hypothetical protein [Cellulosimicrobium cellulans]UKJ63943.1 hypothetical protein H1Q78_00105 [Cellulosimicrobium cellulans]